MMRWTLLAVCSLLSTACDNSPETAVERAARTMNGLNNKALDSATAEGNTLVVRYKPLGLQQLSDSEITKISTAGLCTLDGVKDLVSKGAAIRMEIPRSGRYLTVAVERCEGDTTILAKSGSSGGDWPTGAPIETN